MCVRWNFPNDLVQIVIEYEMSEHSKQKWFVANGMNAMHVCIIICIIAIITIWRGFMQRILTEVTPQHQLYAFMTGLFEFCMVGTLSSFMEFQQTVQLSASMHFIIFIVRDVNIN